ncbi:DUF4397 domain-containing protein [Streptomyces niveus]|uniref:DUF4397 domain-containing protein n=1 Tax=Streptomyces niveus TaxID=193462 RepID=UPI0036D42968
MTKTRAHTRRSTTAGKGRARAAAVLSCLVLGAVAFAGPAGATSSGTAPRTAVAGTGGWLRLAHFSPDTPPVDVYLYPFGGSKAEMVLRKVAYGMASPYEPVDAGRYTVAMRAAGAKATSEPVITSTVKVAEGKAYTVAGLGPSSALQLRALPDQLSASADRAGLRVIQASLSQPSVTVHVASGDRSTLRFPMSTPYKTVPAGPTEVKVSTVSGASTSRTLELTGRSTHTLVVLSSSGAAPKLLDLMDSGGASTQPLGGVEAGLGGLGKETVAAGESPSGSGTAMGWGAALIAGAALAYVSVRRLRRS